MLLLVPSSVVCGHQGCGGVAQWAAGPVPHPAPLCLLAAPPLCHQHTQLHLGMLQLSSAMTIWVRTSHPRLKPLGTTSRQLPHGLPRSCPTPGKPISIVLLHGRQLGTGVPQGRAWLLQLCNGGDLHRRHHFGFQEGISEDTR